MSEYPFLSRTERLYIDVILKDGTYHHFTPRVLSVLLDSHRVHKFKRSDGWATVGIDPLRSRRAGSADTKRFDGQERRMSMH